jgi:deoxycytidylate deaminase
VTVLTEITNSLFYDSKGHRKLRRKLAKTDILVFRETVYGIKNSKPCSECIKTMKNMGIRRVYYSTDDGILVYEKVSDMFSTHRSQMTRHIDRDF